jgi:hypothetical protein
MSMIDNLFQATGPGQFGFFAAPNADSQPIFPWGVNSWHLMTALLDARHGSHGALEGDGCGLYRLAFCP